MESILSIARANRDMDPKRLSEFGLTEAESRVYLALLQTGRAKTGAIIKATAAVSTVYGALPSLCKRVLFHSCTWAG